MWADADIAADEGRKPWLRTVPGERIRMDHVAAYLGEVDQTYTINLLAYDRYQWDKLSHEIDALGLQITQASHPQAAQRPSKPPQELIDQAKAAGREPPQGLWMPKSKLRLEELILDGRIRLLSNPVLISACMSAAVATDPMQNEYFNKQKATQKIDPLVSLAMAVGASALGDVTPVSKASVYEDRPMRFRLSSNTTYAHAFEGDGGSDPEACSAYLDLLGGTEATPGGIVDYGVGAVSFEGVGWFTRKGAAFTTGPDVFWGQYVVKKAATSSYVAATRFMLNVGDKAAAWTDSLSERELRASIQEVRSVAVSADGRSKAIVGNLTDVNGRITGTVSENDGESDSYTVVSSKFVLADPDGAAGTSFADGRWTNPDAAAGTRTVYGRAFGGDQKLEWWTGPASVAVGAETKGNAYVYISRNTVGGPRFGGSDVVGPGGTLTATASTGFIGGARTGGGYVNTSNQVTVTVSGGTAGATIRWVRISGDSRIGMNDPTAFNTGAGATIGVGEVISALFMGAVTKGGQSAVVYVQVDLSDNGT